MNLNYQSSGVNIELGDDASKVLYEAAKLTWVNRKGKLGERLLNSLILSQDFGLFVWVGFLLIPA